jgi:hypothetical protein
VSDQRLLPAHVTSEAADLLTGRLTHEPDRGSPRVAAPNTMTNRRGLDPASVSLARIQEADGFDWFLIVVRALLLAGITEELLSRGVFLGWLRRYLPVWATLLIHRSPLHAGAPTRCFSSRASRFSPHAFRPERVPPHRRLNTPCQSSGEPTTERCGRSASRPVFARSTYRDSQPDP